MTRGSSGRPLLVPVLTLLRQPGTRRAVQLDAILGELRVGEAYVPAATPVALDVVMEAIGDSINVVGEVRAPYSAVCRRCLEPLDEELVAEVQEIFERRPVEGETYPLEGDEIDLEPLVRDAVLLALPLAPLCREDCPGAAPASFPTAPDTADAPDADVSLSGVPGGDSETLPLDPRWAALGDLELD